MAIEKIKLNALAVQDVRERTKNLLKEIVPSSVMNASGDVSSTSSYCILVSDELEPNTEYEYTANYTLGTFPAGAVSFYYDASGQKISSMEGVSNPFTTPADCKYVKICQLQTNGGIYIDHAMIKLSSDSKYYEPYGYVSDYPSIYQSPYLNKKYVPIGDSLTDQTLYPKRVAQALGMIYTVNLGKGGATVWCDATADAAAASATTSISAQSRIDLIPTDTEIITIMIGSNDAGQDKPMGVPADMQMYTITEGNSNPTLIVRPPITVLPGTPNFYNCYAMLLNRIYARVPTARIFLCEIPLRSMIPYELDGDVFADKFQPYRDSVKVVAEKYGYPLLKTYQNAGINELNYEQFIVHTQYDMGIHLSTPTGHERIASVIAAGMKSVTF